MLAAIKENRCKRLRNWLWKLLAERFSIEQQWVQDHIANCPKCRGRIARLGRVDAALALLKAEPHSIDLLMRANTQAIGVLKHSLRETAKACKLRRARPESTILERYGKYKRPLFHAAACVAVAVLLKISTFSSAGKFRAGSQKAVEHYYASRAGEDIAGEVFRSHA